MQTKFWHNAWENGRAGWRQHNVNTRLKRYWPQLDLSQGQRVFVPLCGDSIDMLWLREQGFEVIGSELSELAVKKFFNDCGWQYAETQSGEQRLFSGTGAGQGVHVYCGDYFRLQTAQLDNIAAVYDRAATVAMPPELRMDYASQLSALLQPGTPVVLISMTYDQGKMNGPPFSVPEDHIQDLYSRDFSIEVLSTSSGPEILGNLAERGLDTLDETVYKLTKKDK